MSWRDRLRPASFRGVPFFLDGRGREGGRRVALHEFPGRDEPFAEDLGMASRRWTVEAYVLGGDFLDRLRDLEDALERPGPGNLVLERGSSARVQVERVQVNERNRELGMARLGIVFIPSREQAGPVLSTDSRAVAKSAAEALAGAAAAEYLERVLTKDVPEFVGAAVGRAAAKVVAKLRLTPLLEQADEALEFAVRLDQLGAKAEAGGLGPDAALEGLASTVPLVVEVFGSTATALEVLAGLLAVPAESKVATSAMGKAGEANEQATLDLAAVLAAGQALQVAAELEWASYQEALAWREGFSAQLLSLEQTSGPQVFDQIRTLRAALAETVPAPDNALPQVALYEPAGVLPAEIHSYHLYGSAERGTEIAARNNLRRPLHVPVQPLEVLIPPEIQ